VTDRQTDGIAMAYTRYSIYAVARKNQKWINCRGRKPQKDKQYHRYKAIIDNRLRPSAALWWSIPNTVVFWRYTLYWRLWQSRTCKSALQPYFVWGRPLVGPMVWKHDVIRETGST